MDLSRELLVASDFSAPALGAAARAAQLAASRRTALYTIETDEGLQLQVTRQARQDLGDFFVLGSVTKHVLAYSDCDVLVAASP